MSYVVRVFQPPGGQMPADPQEVSDLVDRLNEAAPRPGSRYRELLRLVQASAAPDQRGDWMAALADDDAGPVFNIAVDSARTERTVALMVRCARTLDMALLDPQAAIAYWPDGRELRCPPRPPVPSVPQVVKQGELDPLLLPAGTIYELYCGTHRRFTNERNAPEVLAALLADNKPTAAGIVNPPFVELERRLERRFGRQAAPGSIWASDLREGADCWNVFPLAVKAEFIREVRPALLDVAHSVNLDVFDPQAAQIHMADGRILWRGEQLLAQGIAGRVDPDGLESQLVALVAPALRPFGFESGDRKGTFLRSFGPVKQEITLYSPSHWDISVNVVWTITATTDLPDTAVQKVPDGKALLTVYGTLKDFATEDDFREPLYLHPWGQGSVTLYRHDKIKPAANEITRVLVERVIPYFGARDSIHSIHAAVNGPGASADRLWPLEPSVRLGVAHLAGQTGLLEMAASELAKLRAFKYDASVRCLDRQSVERETKRMEALLAWLGHPAA